MTPNRKKKSAQQKSATEFGAEVENHGKDSIPETPGVSGPVEELMGETGPPDSNNGADQASYITGETLHVNGGMYMS